MDLHESLQYLIEEAGIKPKVINVHDTGTSEVKLIIDGKTPKLETFDKAPPTRDHTIETLTGLIEYMQSDHCKEDAGIIFVNQDYVVMDLNYRAHPTHRVRLPLLRSEEFEGLQLITGKCPIKALWRELVTRLAGAFPPTLLLAISQLNVRGQGYDNVQIDATGIESGSAGMSFNIGFTGKDGTHDVAIDTEWEWSGRIYECFERETIIQCRLELSLNDGKILVQFHPRRLQTTLRENRQALVEEIRAHCPSNFTVYEGTL